MNACTGALEGWPIPNICDTLKRIGDAKPTVFGLIDLPQGIIRQHFIKIHEHSLHLYVPLDYSNGLQGLGPYFQRSMASVVLAGLVYIICEIYIDDMLIHGRSEEDFLVNLRKVLDQLRTFNVGVVGS